MKILLMLLVLFCFLPAALAEESKVHVEKVDNLPEDFIFGMDASCVPALERSGVKYYNFHGEEADVYQLLADNGFNYIRVRIWNDPYDKAGRGYGGGNCDIDNAIAIGQRVTRQGMKLLVNFHYSDFWADPSKQMVPKAWQGMDIQQKAEAVYQYTHDCLTRLKNAGVDVGMVQVGNETNAFLCGETDWDNITLLMKSGLRAVREVFPQALAALHFANPEQPGRYATYARELHEHQVDYDVFASSYYPFWHGSLDNLTQLLSMVANTYGKKVMVMETSYAYTGEDTDFSRNSIGDGSQVAKPYPYTVQGQADHLRALTDALVNRTENALGLVYWEGTWITVGGRSWEENRLLWERCGSGWASSYAGEYDPHDAGLYYGGSAVDNQALFDQHGKPLETLRILPMMRQGSNN